MKNPIETEPTGERRRVMEPFPMIIIGLSVVTIIATFLLANSDLEVTTKTRGFSAMIAAFLIICVSLHFVKAKRGPGSRVQKTPVDRTIDEGLDALEEAGRFFAGSIRASDTFRLVASRVRELLPFRTAVLFRLDASRTTLQVAHAEGAGADGQRDRSIRFDEELAGQCFVGKCVQVDGYLALDESQDFGASVAIPLFNGTEVYGVMQLYFDSDYELATADHSLFEAVGTRVSPLILTAISYERSQANALTDVTTDLPNERAFYLVLENQIAEAVRKREERPLTILAIDIKNFDEVNERFGHASGDRVLNFVARGIKDNLRQMDFLARSIGDEFLAVLPTATKEVSHEVIARIHTAFFGRKLRVNDQESVEVELNVGWAAFGSDGETPGQLLSLAQLRKEQGKTIGSNKVVWFPQETAH